MEVEVKVEDNGRNITMNGGDNLAYEEDDRVDESANKNHVKTPVSENDVNGRRRVSYASDVTETSEHVSKTPEDNETSAKATIDDSKRSGPLLYRTGDNPPIHMLIFFGFQQALLSLSASLALVLIAADVICANDDDVFKSQLLSSTLFMNGVSTLLMVTVGSRLPLYQGAYGGYIIPLLTLLQIDPNRCTINPPSLNITVSNNNMSVNTTGSMPFDMEQAKKDLVIKYFQEVQGCLILVGLIHSLIGFTGLVGILLRFIGPLTIVPTIVLLGMYAADPVLDFVVADWGVSTMTCAIGMLLSFYLSKWNMPIPIWTKSKGFRVIRYPLHQVYAILISIIVSWLVSLIITEAGGFTDDKSDKQYKARTDARLDSITNAPWFFFPYPGLYGPLSFNSTVFIGFMIATFISILDSIGDYYACATASHVPPPPSHAVNRGIGVEGFCTMIAGAVGCPQATTTYGANIGAIGITKVASRRVFIVCAIIYMVFGVLGKVSAVFVTIPYPVLGGSMVIMIGMVFGVVLSLLESVNLNSTRNLAVIGLSLMVGIIVPLWVKKYPEDIETGNQEADFILKGLLGNPNFCGAVLACFLDNTMPGSLEDRGIAAWNSPDDVTASAPIDYVEGVDIYDIWLPEKIKYWKGWKYIPFMPSPARKRQRSLSHQWARRKSVGTGIHDTMV